MINIKPIIGIVGRLYSGESNIICVEEIRLAISKMGGVPLLILPLDKVNFCSKDKSYYTDDDILGLKSVLNLCDGFVLPGGDDWYQLDEIVIDYAVEKDKPLLAICLGMQALSKVLSDDKRIAYDNTVKNNTSINHYLPNKDYVHDVIIKKDSKLFSIIKKSKINVNSRHNYHIPLIDSFYISARSTDGLVEAVEIKDKKFIIGLQWHPESNLDTDINSRKIFASFFDNFKCSQKFH